MVLGRICFPEPKDQGGYLRPPKNGGAAVGPNGGHPFIAWTILDEAERKRHLMKGLQDACDRGSWGQDGRALCPEITLGPMLMQRGKGFTDFFRHYVNGKKGVGEDDVYFLPSEWWQKAVDMSEPLPEAVELTYKLLSIQRNEFIGKSLDAHADIDHMDEHHAQPDFYYSRDCRFCATCPTAAQEWTLL
jgi:hypothetical protein